MSRDRELIDTIKWRFERKSSDQLRQIALASAGGDWSDEAVAAAVEVLRDRAAGLAREPVTPEDDSPPPPGVHFEPAQVALGLLTGLVTGVFIIPYYRRTEWVDPDLPIPFGPRMAWLAVDSTDAE